MPSLPPAINLECRAEGDEGSLVVALHDLGRPSAHIMDALRSLVGERRRVVAVSLRGHGGSPTPPGPWSIDDIASDVARLVSAEGGPTILVGVGLGAATAMALTLGHPGMVSGLVLSGLGPRAEEEVGRDRWMLIARKLRERSGAEGLALAAEAMATRPDLRGALSHVEVPTMIIAGASDRATPPEVQREFVSLIRGSNFRIAEGAGHDLPTERPTELADAVRWLIANGHELMLI